MSAPPTRQTDRHHRGAPTLQHIARRAGSLSISVALSPYQLVSRIPSR